jgi:hypothetical protein
MASIIGIAIIIVPSVPFKSTQKKAKKIPLAPGVSASGISFFG